jgi:hypothetical protein
MQIAYDRSSFYFLKKSLLLCNVIMHILFTILGREFYLTAASFYILFRHVNLLFYALNILAAYWFTTLDRSFVLRKKRVRK